MVGDRMGDRRSDQVMGDRMSDQMSDQVMGDWRSDQMRDQTSEWMRDSMSAVCCPRLGWLSHFPHCASCQFRIFTGALLPSPRIPILPLPYFNSHSHSHRSHSHRSHSPLPLHRVCRSPPRRWSTPSHGRPSGWVLLLYCSCTAVVKTSVGHWEPRLYTAME